MTKKILVLPGDGIGQEIVAEAMKVIQTLQDVYGLKVETEQALVGGAAYDASGHPLPEATLSLAKQADAVLLGAVGGYQYDALPREMRPERGLLRIRSFNALEPKLVEKPFLRRSSHYVVANTAG